MIKTIHIEEGQSFDINSSSGWLYIYQEQFGHDVLPVLLPAVEAIIGLIADLMKNTDGKTDDAMEILKAADGESIANAFITLSGMQLVTIQNIVWAMAKNANYGIENPREWANKFDIMPWDKVAPQVLNAALEASISKKKYEAVQAKLKTIAPSALSELQSQPSTED